MGGKHVGVGEKKKEGNGMMNRTTVLKATHESGESENEPIVRRQLRIGDRHLT